MGESRTELLAWVNNLLQMNLTKIEECGKGVAYCQVMDSIFLDFPLGRVKFGAKQEYEYLHNFKILQTYFKNKKIEKPIPVERLVKCKMQDNLEFMQWLKRYWDANFPGQEYDAVGRRRGGSVDMPATIAPIGGGGGASTLRSSAGPGASSAARAGGRTPIGGARIGGGGLSAQASEQIARLQAENAEYRASLEGLEKERDFYFAKLRDIEILVQAQLEKVEAAEAEGAPAGQDDDTLKEIQKILYSTEEGFEVPDANPVVDEEETF